MNNLELIEAKKMMKRQFLKKGIVVAMFSAITYGLYTATLTMGMSQGVWFDWYGANTAGLSAFVIVYVLGAVGAAVNDSISAIWTIVYAIYRGKLGDFFRCLKTKPGKIMILAALIGGPIGGCAYIIGLQLAGSLAVPIAALCPVIGAILGRILFKQQLNLRMTFGILICIVATFLIGCTSFGEGAPSTAPLGICIAFIASLSWGFEGCVCGFGTTMIDPEIGITIRQVTSAIIDICILVPLMGFLAGDVHLSFDLLGQAYSSNPALIWFIFSGLFSMLTFMTWYSANGMCGAALGMSCNATYSFWGPLFCWILLGLIFGIDGWGIPPIAWFAAVLMIVGIIFIALNPLDLLKKKEEC